MVMENWSGNGKENSPHLSGNLPFEMFSLLISFGWNERNRRGGTFSKKKKKEGINIVYTEKYLHKVVQFID